ncbi:hypothetical protein AAHA92_31470 [Salvia divinorum]|uniref:Uncharacterized protein n=1 Tax=Salvia divinorum TaxID=28513 RepID=A0ABD1FT01_SALDI
MPADEGMAQSWRCLLLPRSSSFLASRSHRYLAVVSVTSYTFRQMIRRLELAALCFPYCRFTSLSVLEVQPSLRPSFGEALRGSASIRSTPADPSIPLDLKISCGDTFLADLTAGVTPRISLLSFLSFGFLGQTRCFLAAMLRERICQEESPRLAGVEV